MLEHKSFSFKADSLEDGEFTGHAAVFGNLDSYGDIIAPGAFNETLQSFKMDGVVAWQHDWRTPIGKPVETYEDNKGLYIKGKISDTQAGRDALTLLRDNVIGKMSIGYQTLESEWFDDTNKLKDFAVSVGMQLDLSKLEAIHGGVRVLKKVKLFEVSLVTVPANDQASITAVKDLNPFADSSPHAGMPFGVHLDAVLAAVDSVIIRAKQIQELRIKEGRKEGQVLSQASRKRISRIRDTCTRCMDEMKMMVDDMDSFLAETDPNPKPETESAHPNHEPMHTGKAESEEPVKADQGLIAQLLVNHELIKRNVSSK